MSRNVIQVPIKRRARAVKEVFYQDPVTGNRAIRGREWTDPKTARTCKVEVYDARGEVIYTWTSESSKPLNGPEFQAANHISRQSFEARGVQ